MNVKQGDLAIIVSGKPGSKVVGKIVKVIVLEGHYQGDYGLVGPAWEVEAMRPIPVMERFADGSLFREVVSTIFTIADSRLRPISGIPDTDDADESISRDAGISLPA